MLVTTQFPFADLRPFVGDSTRRLLTPDWPTPRAGTDFVRLLGQVRDRRRGGVKEWPGEHIFCEAARGIRFDPSFSGKTTIGARRRYCAFRRFYADGAGFARVDIGVAFSGKEPWTMKELLSALHDAASLPVAIGRGAQTVRAELLKAGPSLARLVLSATTSRQADGDFTAPGWWFAPCEPMMLIEQAADVDGVPVPPTFTRAAHTSESGVELSYGRLELGGRPIGVWHLGVQASADPNYRRRLRIHLLRLHAQREVVKEVLRAIHTGRLAVVRTKPEDLPEHPSNRLQSFLHETIRQMEQKAYSGLPQSELLRAAEEIQDSMTEGERTAILERLRPLRKAVFSAVERFTDDRGSARTIVVVNEGGEFHMVENQQNVNVTGSVGGNVQVNQLVADQISNALNTIQQSTASDDLKAKLTQLHALVDQLAKKAPPDAQSKAAKNLEALTKEATSAKPDPAWYQVSADGLIEAAKTVAEMTGPITTAVKAVLALLA
jgi:hypothetical protein